MKKNILYLLLVCGLAACTPERAEFINFTYLEGFVDSLYPESAFHPYEAVLVDFDKGLPPTPSLPGVSENEAVHPDSTGSVRHASSLPAASIMQSILGTTQAKKTWQIAGIYGSVDQNGDSIVLSGKVVLPEKGPIRNIVVVSHYTIGANYEAPSQSFPFEGIFAGHGYAVIVPDYIGFGITSHLPHPYMATELTAQNVVDMYRAVLPYLQAINKLPEDSAIYLSGYSQGGATSLAVQYYLETNYPDVKIIRNFCGGGPYDLAATYDKWIAEDFTGYSPAVPMIIQGMNVAERLNLDYKIFFKQNLLDSYDQVINSKKYTVAQQAQLIGTNRPSEIVTEECRDKRTNDSFKLYRAFMRNSIAYQWQPQAPVYMFHSMDDDVVPYENAIKAREQFYFCNVEYNFGHYGPHQLGYLTFLGIVNNFLKK